ncbi:hypothetical protein PspLS_04348 [Pyricularia sp. CBS 133598]|nr:hypothetical protein PspLS_04348 [Pyricularia sp. CBS 133598]
MFSLKSAVTAALLAVGSMVSADSFPFERLNKNDSVLIILDIQVGLYQLARDFDPTLYQQNILAHAALGKVFDIPTIITTSAETGPNGPTSKDILDMYPNTTVVKRNGEVDAWDNAEFRKAVEATGKKQVILAGIVTDVCTTFAALSLRDAGYSVWANIEASGTTTALIRDVSNSRMERAGVQMVSLFSIVCDLMRDWRETPGAIQLLPWLDRYMPAYGYLARGHVAAVRNGTIIPGSENLQ